MQKTQERVIDGTRFAVTQLPAMRGFKMFHRLGRALGPAIAQVAGGLKGKLAEMNVAELGAGVGALLERLDENDLEAITGELLKTAHIDGKPLMPSFDLLMQGRIPTLLKLLAFAIEVNYGNFRDWLPALADQASKQPELPSQSG
jgi:hypothetical protein